MLRVYFLQNWYALSDPIAVPMLAQLLNAEVAKRKFRSTAYHIKAPRFPAYKQVSDFDFAASEINEATVCQLHRGDFVDGAQNVVLIGGPGTGKTHVATALSVRAVEHHLRNPKDDGERSVMADNILDRDFTADRPNQKWLAALEMVHRHSPGSTWRLTLGANKEYGAAQFVSDLRMACVTTNVAQKSRYSAIEGPTTRHHGYALSIKHRKRIEKAFGWAKTAGGIAGTVYRGAKRVRSRFILTMASNNLARLSKFLVN